jgi:hypothetical protein
LHRISSDTSLMRQTLITLIIALFLPASALGSIYGYEDDVGTYHFTNVKPANRKYVVVIDTKEPVRGASQGVSVPWRDDEERQGLIKQAKSLLGMPYKLGGEGPNGIDCSAYVKRTFSAFDVALPRTAREQYEVGKKVSRNQLSMGDLVFFRTKANEEHPTHVGIYMGNGQFIHASALRKGGVRVDSLSDDFYDKRFLGATRLKSLPGTGGTAIITASK